MSSLDDSNSSLCRICLDEGATLAIFNSEGNEGSIYSKITKCVNLKVEDVDGYPRFICEKCKNTLETVCNFIDTFIESSKIIEAGLLKSIKHEIVTQFELYSDFDYSDVDVKLKEETNFKDTELESKLVEPLVLRIKRESCVTKKNLKNKNGKSRPKNKTNRIGSSMLEGEFKWDGENWSLHSNHTTLKTPLKRATKFPSKPKKKEKKVKVPKPKPELSKLCDICGEIFENPNQVTCHKRKKHETQSVQCPKCPRKCVSKYYLNRHLKRKHESTRDFICSLCGKQFVFKAELSGHHKSVHEKHLKPKKNFKCKICDKTFKCQKSVVVHERSVHTGERPAVCSVCQSTFYHEEYLREHMRLHTGETPFKCPICGRGYAQSGNMKSHLRNHRVADIPPDVLSKIRPSYIKFLKDYR
ncbi:zinc finger protein 43-like [Plodia interpunctella]|uniref:zinc finger protein 43-like n=1 Tax=Plodia interpunctella TaxID=58824 RepID=UPI0023675C11|nr:zinc finger protein 43-like [Plodia interpunctella]